MILSGCGKRNWVGDTVTLNSGGKCQRMPDSNWFHPSSTPLHHQHSRYYALLFLRKNSWALIIFKHGFARVSPPETKYGTYLMSLVILWDGGKRSWLFYSIKTMNSFNLLLQGLFHFSWWKAVMNEIWSVIIWLVRWARCQCRGDLREAMCGAYGSTSVAS